MSHDGRHATDDHHHELHVTSILAPNEKQDLVPVYANDSDEEVLGALGYKQEFKRDLTWIESFAVSFSVLGLLPSIASTLGWNLAYSGLSGTVWGWLIAALAIQSVVFGMAELCSSMPTAGGLYYAAAVLAPEGWGPLASYIVGWSNTLAFGVGPCSINYALAQMILAAGSISNPDYIPKQWHVYLLLLLILFIQGFLTMQSTKFIGRLNIIGTVSNLLALLIFVIWLPAASINRPKFNDNHDVWIKTESGTEWPWGWSMIMGFTSVLYTLAGKY